MGIIGVAMGLAATLGTIVPHASTALTGQMAAVLGVGGAIGIAIARSIAITDLPQLVAAFHSLVGLAAAATSVVSFVMHPGQAQMAIWFGTVIGAITFTGSIVAFGKLQGLMSSKPWSLPNKHFVNATLAGMCCAALPWILPSYVSAGAGLNALLFVSAVAMFLGYHLTMAVGGGDMPVVITVLNRSALTHPRQL